MQNSMRDERPKCRRKNRIETCNSLRPRFHSTSASCDSIISVIEQILAHHNDSLFDVCVSVVNTGRVNRDEANRMRRHVSAIAHRMRGYGIDNTNANHLMPQHGTAVTAGGRVQTSTQVGLLILEEHKKRAICEPRGHSLLPPFVMACGFASFHIKSSH